MTRYLPEYAAAMQTLCRQAALPCPVSEYRFDRLSQPRRRWMFDFAWVEQQVAMEIEGGLFVDGRHSRGKGYLGDLEKYNSAQLQGWKVMRYSPSQFYSGDWCADIKYLLETEAE